MKHVTKPLTKHQRAVIAKHRDDPEGFPAAKVISALRLTKSYQQLACLFYRCTKADAIDAKRRQKAF